MEKILGRVAGLTGIGNKWLCLLLALHCKGRTAPRPLSIVVAGHSAYSIVLPDRATKAEQEASRPLQGYFKMVFSVEMPVREEKDTGNGSSGSK